MRILTLVFIFLSVALSAYAHEIRPAYLELAEESEGIFQASWKQPVADGRRLALEPVLPLDCASLEEPQIRVVEGAVVSRWRVACPMREGLIAIAGLERTLTDVFIEVRYLDGDVRRAVIRPGEAGLELGSGASFGARAYLQLGVEHILSGPDHLLFVSGLLLLARLRRLIFVITAFTLAHSLTLALTSLGWVRLAAGPVELMIAVSILLLAVEAMRVIEGRPSFTAQRPWLVSFGFGLLHGFGFAGALGDIGLPVGAELAALFYFNVGVELGQLLFIGALLSMIFILVQVLKVRLSSLQRAAAYCVGISGAYWVIERFGALFVG